jgi:transposase
MSAVKYVVRLTGEEREQVNEVIRRGRWPARKVARARVLVKADEGWSDGQIAAALDLGVTTVWRTRKRFVEEGLDRALHERPRLGHRPKLDGKGEAHLIAVACSKPPEGHARWTLRLLADRVVELGLTEAYSRESVRRVLKKTT